MAKMKQWQLDDQLRRAVDSDNLDRVREMLARGANPQATPEAEFSLLALSESVAIARLLIEAGADPCAIDREGWTPGQLKRKAFEAATARGIAGFLPMLGAMADYLEEEARLRTNAKTVRTRTPEVQMTAEEERARAQNRRV